MSCTRSGKIYSNASASVNANVSKEEVRPVFFEPRPASATRRSMRLRERLSDAGAEVFEDSPEKRRRSFVGRIVD